jgi:hypothetical protein
MIFSILVNIECIVDFSEFSPGKNKAKISPDIRGVKQRRLEELRGAFFSTFPHPPLTTALSSHVVVVVTHDDTNHHTTR